MGAKMRTAGEAAQRLTHELLSAGWSVAPDALDSLQKIDFTKLVAIHDHEEYFLERMLIGLLLSLLGARSRAPGQYGEVTKADIETALRMLGVAAGRQDQAALSAETKAAIKDSCGFC